MTCQTPVGLLHLSQQHPLLTGPDPAWQGHWFPGGFVPCSLAQLLSLTSMTLALVKVEAAGCLTCRLLLGVSGPSVLS